MPDVCLQDKRIFIVSPTESELTMRGRRHPNLARFLCRRGWQVTYLSSNFYHAEKRLFSDEEYMQATKNLPYKLHLLRVGMYRKNLSFRRVLWNELFAYRCYRKLEKILTEKDVLIIPSRPPELIYAAARLKRRCNCRIVLDIRDIWPDMLSDTSRTIIAGFRHYCEFFLRRSMPFIDDFIHVAPSFLPWLKRYVADAESTFIPLGFDEKRWGIDPPEYQSSRGIVVKMVHCGTLSNQLDVLPVLQAMAKKTRNLHLTLIGDNGSGDRYSEVMNFINNHKLSSQVTVMGLLPPEKLVLELRRHDLTIIPMISGALPNKFFDSIASGLPIISLGDGDSSWFVKRDDLGWTAPFDPDSIDRLFDELTQENLRLKALNTLKVRSEYMHSNLYLKYEEVLQRFSGFHA